MMGTIVSIILLVLFQASRPPDASVAQRDHQGNHARQKPPHPPHPVHPPHPGNPTPTPNPTPAPTPTGHSYIIRIYDYTDIYSQYVQKEAAYYEGFLEAMDPEIDVQYMRGPVMDGPTCWSTNPSPQIGIKMCEEINFGTAASTGMVWQQTGPTTWELSSSIVFNWAAPETLFGPDKTRGGDWMSCHELGHSTANLPHRPITDEPFSCMSDTGSYTPDTLTDAEKQQIIAALPGTGAAAARSHFHPHQEKPPR
jgi:hypothetical protein